MNKIAKDLLLETQQHIANAVDSLDRLIALHEKKTASDQPRFRRKIQKLLHSEAISRERKIKILGSVTRLFTLLCRLDDQRNDLKCFQSNLEMLIDLQQVPASEIPYWRQKFYETIATVYILGNEFDGT